MIVKNEEEVLSRCLESAKEAFDEIIIVDTGSFDKTKEIARRFTDKIYDFEWIDDFSAARNFSFSKASSQYIMWLDADDVIEKDDLEKIIALKTEIAEKNADTIYLKYHIAFDLIGRPIFSYYRERILRRCGSALWQEPVHEAITPFGSVLFSEAAVTHRKIKSAENGRNLGIYEKHITAGKAMSSRMKYYYARELMFNGKTEKAIGEFENLLTEKNAWTENLIGACRDLSGCYRKTEKPEKAIEALFKSFTFSYPRAEILCEIGLHFMNENRLKEAAYWYEAALKTKLEDNSLAFTEPDCAGFIPAIQLAVIYDKLGDLKTANSYNETAGSFKPEHTSYISNKKYFERVLNTAETDRKK